MLCIVCTCCALVPWCASVCCMACDAAVWHVVHCVQVLGRNEFKALLKWRLAVRKTLKGQLGGAEAEAEAEGKAKSKEKGKGEEAEGEGECRGRPVGWRAAGVMVCWAEGCWRSGIEGCKAGRRQGGGPGVGQGRKKAGGRTRGRTGRLTWLDMEGKQVHHMAHVLQGCHIVQLYGCRT